VEEDYGQTAVVTIVTAFTPVSMEYISICKMGRRGSNRLAVRNCEAKLKAEAFHYFTGY
jgi:hypothetical protein